LAGADDPTLDTGKRGIPASAASKISYYRACRYLGKNGYPEISSVSCNGDQKSVAGRETPRKEREQPVKGRENNKKEVRPLQPGQQRQLEDFLKKIKILQRYARTGEKNLVQVIDYILNDIGYAEHLQKKIKSESKKENKNQEDRNQKEETKSESESERVENLNELKRRARTFQEEEWSDEQPTERQKQHSQESTNINLVRSFLHWICSQSADEER